MKGFIKETECNDCGVIKRQLILLMICLSMVEIVLLLFLYAVQK
jgi:hypothetical protein